MSFRAAMLDILGAIKADAVGIRYAAEVSNSSRSQHCWLGQLG